MKPQRIHILGVPVDCVDMDGAVAAADAMIATERAHCILAVNPEKVMRANADAVLMQRLRAADVLIPDGIGVVVAARLSGAPLTRRVPGAELMPELCALAARRGYGVFLFGASAEVNRRAREELHKRFPLLHIAGGRDGYVHEDEMPRLIDAINRSGAQLLFIALGSPKQELWIERYLSRLSTVRVCQGVGGTFDVLAGTVRRAPKLFRALHLEWFYRLMSQPRRLLRQTALPRFAWSILRARLRGATRAS